MDTSTPAIKHKKVTVMLPDGTAAIRRTERPYQFAVVGLQVNIHTSEYWHEEKPMAERVAPLSKPVWKAISYHRTHELALRAHDALVKRPWAYHFMSDYRVVPTNFSPLQRKCLSCRTPILPEVSFCSQACATEYARKAGE